LKVKPTSSTSATVTIEITNTGSRAGDDVVQYYIKDAYSSVVRPLLELKRFRRITLNAGEKRTVTFTLEKDGFAFYDVVTKDWIVEPGTFEIMVGSSSRDIRATASLEQKLCDCWIRL